MNHWEVLGISQTEDENAVREAYLSQLPLHHPEDDPEGFKRLREALEEALKEAREQKCQREGLQQGAQMIGSQEIQGFLKEAEAVYQDYSRRIRTEEWEKVLSLPICQDLESQKEAGWALLSFLMDHHHLPHEGFQAFDKVFGWTDDEEEVYRHFPEGFVRYLMERIRHEDAESFRYGCFEIREDFDYDQFCELFFDLKKALRDKEREAAESAIKALDGMGMEHPDFTIQKIRHESFQKGHERQAWELARDLLMRDGENLSTKFWYVRTAMDYKDAQADPEKIEGLLKSMLDENPENPAYWQLLGSHMRKAGDLERALSANLRARRYLNERWDYLEEEIVQVAEELSRQQEEDPDNDDWWDMANVCWLGHRYSRTRMLLEGKEPEEDNRRSWLFLMAGSCHELGDYQAAVRYRQEIWDITDPEERPLNLFLDLAEDYKGAGDTKRALAIYEEAQECFPESPEAYYQKGRLLFDLDRCGEALEQCDKGLKGGFHLDSFYLRLELLLEMERYEEAKEDAKRVIGQGLRSAQVLFDYVRALRKLEENEEAESVLKELVERVGETGTICQEYASLCSDTDRPQEALEWIEKAIRDKDSLMRQLMKSGYLYELKRYKEAAASYQALVGKGMDDSYIYNRIGRAMESMREFPEAEGYYRKAVEASPQYGVAWDNLGDVLQDQGKWDEAIEAYKKGWGCGNQQAIRDLCRLLKRTHADEEAMEYLRQGLERFPDDGSLLWIQALMLKRLEQYDEAVRCLNRYIELKPSQAPSGYREIASCWEDREDYTKAEEYYQKAIDHNPKEAKSWRLFGKYYANKRKMQEKALPYLEKAVELDPESLYGWMKLGEVYEALGRQEEAISCYETSLKNYKKEIEKDPYDCCNYEGAADVLAHLGRLDEAEEMAHHALSLQNEVFYCSCPFCYEGLEDLAKVEEKRGNLKKALEWMQLAGRLGRTDYYPKEIQRLQKALEGQ